MIIPLSTTMFWAVAAAVATSGMITTGLASTRCRLLGECGPTTAQAAANVVPQTAAAIIATLLMGVLVDRVAPSRRSWRWPPSSRVPDEDVREQVRRLPHAPA